MMRINNKQAGFLGGLSLRLIVVGGLVLIFAILWQFNMHNRQQLSALIEASKEAEYSHKMRDAVRMRQQSIQRMLNARDIFEQDEEYQRYLSYGTQFLLAREQLKFLDDSSEIRQAYHELLDAVNFAQPYHQFLIESIMFGRLNEKELWETVNRGSMALEAVLDSLDRIVELQQLRFSRLVVDYDKASDLRWLLTSVIFAISIMIAMLLLRKSAQRYDHVQQMSSIDGVSGTYNRRYFDMVLEDEWKRSMREYTPISLIMVDIDYFKPYNDRFGHQLGDTCLFSVASILGGQLKRATDFIARYGGEEFVVLLPKTNLAYARKLAERMRQAIEDAHLDTAKKDICPWLTVSIGVATTIAEFEEPSSALVRAADQCLYKSKTQGRNRVNAINLEQLELAIAES